MSATSASTCAARLRVGERHRLRDRRSSPTRTARAPGRRRPAPPRAPRPPASSPGVHHAEVEPRPGGGHGPADHPRHAARGDERAGPRHPEHAGRRRHVLVHPAEPDRRVERHRHRAGVERAEEGVEEGRLGAEHDGHPVARPDAAAARAPGGAAGPGVDLGPGEPHLLLPEPHEGDARGMARRRREHGGQRRVAPGRSGRAPEAVHGVTSGRGARQRRCGPGRRASGPRPASSSVSTMRKRSSTATTSERSASESRREASSSSSPNSVRARSSSRTMRRISAATSCSCAVGGGSRDEPALPGEGPLPVRPERSLLLADAQARGSPRSPR